jgi:hypothetical protein
VEIAGSNGISTAEMKMQWDQSPENCVAVRQAEDEDALAAVGVIE